VLTFIWGLRLTHSYFRREEWKFGVREDWRYTKMAIDYGNPLWYFVSFFAVGVAQHPMIVGISLPLYSV
jgi:steroid 5-alpha reductase family enzyme